MSVIVTVKFPISTQTMEKVVNDHAQTMAAIGDERRHGWCTTSWPRTPTGTPS